jgi:hypothetical protein
VARRELKDLSKNELIRRLQSAEARLREHAQELGDEPSGNPGTMVDAAGDPYARHGVIIDARNAVLMQNVNVSMVEPHGHGAPPDPILALTLGGRINKRTEHAEHLYLFDVDGAAAIVSELFGVARRIGPEFAELLQSRLKAMP